MHSQHPSRGYTLIEALFAVTLVAVLGGAASAQIAAAVDAINAAAAARYLAARFQDARMEALRRNANVALRFQIDGADVSYAMYRDGNRNGLLTRDIERGADPCVRAAERLTERFRGVVIGVEAGLPPVEPGGTGPGSDPVRFGAANMATFTPGGTSTPGSLYVRSARGIQYVVRVFGDTGRTRILRFHRESGTWKQL